MRSKDWLTAEEARRRLAYDPETGRLIWKVLRDSTRIGQEAKSVDVHGYIQVNVAGTLCKGHRLAWLIHHGEWPDGEIDHINGQRADNRLCNLRLVPAALNAQNKRRALANNRSGYLGVVLHKGAYRATITVQGKQRNLGRYPTPEAAHQAYVEAKRRLHEGCTL